MESGLTLEGFIERVKADQRRITGYDEARTKQEIVLKILSLLEWETYNSDEVRPEYSVGKQQVDFALRLADHNKVFIEVKKPAEDLHGHEEQLLSYSFHEGVKLAILTNGLNWWFYLPLSEGNWEKRKVCEIDLISQSTPVIASRLDELLARRQIETGKANENAERILRQGEDQRKLRVPLKEAWSKILDEPSQRLVELLSQATKELCGLEPEPSLVREFLGNYGRGSQPPAGLDTPQREDDKSPVIRRGRPRTRGRVAGEIITGFRFRDRRYKITYWIDLLMQLSRIILNLEGRNFEKTLTLRGSKRPYFSKNRNELRKPGRIENSNIFVETHLGRKDIKVICERMLKIFGYTERDFEYYVG